MNPFEKKTMGKILVGHFGKPPEAEAVEITLKDCHQRLGLTPSDFVSLEPPSFFKKAHGAMGKYIVFWADAAEIQDAAVWRAGYYLLPLEAADVLQAFNQKNRPASKDGVREFSVESKTDVPPDILARASRWAVESQPLFFKCHCPSLILKMDSPAVLRKHWRARLTCPKRCVPAMKTLI